MKHFLTRCSLVVCLLFALAVVPVQAAQSYSHLYISISDALMNTKQDKEAKAELALEQFAADWASVTTEEVVAKEKIDEVLAQAVEASAKEDAINGVVCIIECFACFRKTRKSS